MNTTPTAACIETHLGAILPAERERVGDPEEIQVRRICRPVMTCLHAQCHPIAGFREFPRDLRSLQDASSPGVTKSRFCYSVPVNVNPVHVGLTLLMTLTRNKEQGRRPNRRRARGRSNRRRTTRNWRKTIYSPDCMKDPSDFHPDRVTSTDLSQFPFRIAPGSKVGHFSLPHGTEADWAAEKAVLPLKARIDRTDGAQVDVVPFLLKLTRDFLRQCRDHTACKYVVNDRNRFFEFCEERCFLCERGSGIAREESFLWKINELVVIRRSDAFVQVFPRITSDDGESLLPLPIRFREDLLAAVTVKTETDLLEPEGFRRLISRVGVNENEE